MKLYKIFAIALAAMTMTACSDDDNDYNSADDVIVEMQQAQMNVSEDFNGTYYNIPVVVIGDANGPISVTVELTADSADPAVEDQDYVVTSKTITIPSDTKIGNIQFYPVGDNDENPDRIFVATITKAEGAKIGTNQSCIVTLLDNERLLPEAYAKVQGDWIMSCSDGEYPMTISGYEEGEDGYLTSVVMSGWGGYDICQGVAGFSLDASTGQVQLSIPFGQIIATVNFTGFGPQDVQLIGFDGTYIYPTGSMAAVSNEDVTEFVFPQGVAGAFNSDGWRVWFTEVDLVLKRAN